MTSNQIAYQQMLADTRKKQAEAASQEMSNEIQRLETDVKKFLDYDVREKGYFPPRTQLNEHVFRRSADLASELISTIIPLKLNFSFK